jgi:two-component system, sensor histidine kinase and response regulator
MGEDPSKVSEIEPVLLVDDAPRNLLAFRAVLEPLAREIVTAASGEEAIGLLAHRQFALMLIDVRMPGLDGFATVDRMRHQLQRPTPVIFITADGDNGAMRRAYEFGAVDYLVKPVDPAILLGKVRNLLTLHDQQIELERRAALVIQQQQRLAIADATARRQDTNIGIVAHDLRAPLGAIRTGVTLLRMTTQTPERVIAISERIDRSCERMAVMIRDILDFARGRLAGGIPLTRTRMDLDAACRAIVSETEAAHPNARIDASTSGDTQGTWDQARVEQALSNLLANAVEHGDGTVALHISGEDSNRVSVSVHNQGPAIPPERLPGVFEPFQKGDEGGNGLGLGLFIVREIVRAHEGTVDVASTAQGTTFTVSLPRDRDARAARVPVADDA